MRDGLPILTGPNIFIIELSDWKFRIKDGILLT